MKRAAATTGRRRLRTRRSAGAATQPRPTGSEHAV